MTTIDLTAVLEELAHAIAEDGVAGREAQIEFLAAEARDEAPSAAAVLIDPNAAEIVRQRAFGIVHGVLVRQVRADRSLTTTTRRISELYRLAA